VQWLLHASQSVVLPSSQSSPGSTWPSPQYGRRWHSASQRAGTGGSHSAAQPGLERARRRAAVAVGRIAVVAVFRAAPHPVAAARDGGAPVATGVAVVGIAVVAFLARLDEAVAADRVRGRERQLD